MTGETILVVEDEGLIALHLTELLEKAGYPVIGPVNSGEKAMQLIGEPRKPDLVLMDVKLAGAMDGIETSKLIRKALSVPIVFITAYSTDRTRERIAEIAPEGYLTKPVMEKDLLAVIGGVLEKAGKKG